MYVDRVPDKSSTLDRATLLNSGWVKSSDAESELNNWTTNTVTHKLKFAFVLSFVEFIGPNIKKNETN